MTACAAVAERIQRELGLPTLVGRGVTLREPRLSDAPSLYGVLRDQGVARFLSPPPRSIDGFEQFVAWSQNERFGGRHLCYAIVPGGVAQAVGLIQIRGLDPMWEMAEWGFVLARPYWGTGLFVNAATLAVDFAFHERGVHRLEARALVVNGRGNGVLSKLGAHAEGMLHGSFLANGRSQDQILWTLLADEWCAARPEPEYARTAPLTGRPERQAPGGTRPATLSRWREGMAPLHGQNVTLRELEIADAASLAALLSTAAVTKWILPPPPSPAAFERFVNWTHRERSLGQGLCLGIVPHGSDTTVGLFQLRQLEPSFRIAEWGFALGEPYWGSGAFMDGARLVLDFAFDVIGVHRLEARAAVANGRGNGALRKIGAIREGELRRSFLLGGRYVDDALWAILADRWHKTRRQ